MSLLPALSFFLCLALLSWLLRTGHAGTLALDHPNHRSLHVTPTPRVGGLGLIGATLVAMLGLGQWVLALLTFVLAWVSWIDDRHRVPILLRFGVQCAAVAAWVSYLSVDFAAMWAILLLVWMVNVYNFMDGSDGLAGGMAAFGFATYGVSAWLGGDSVLALLCVSVAAAALGFLRFNFPPARLFMGDVGSIPLGFIAGALGYHGWRAGLWPSWFPLLVFSPFIVDATLTLLRRAWRRERVWQAHCEHYYQRLVRMGYGHRQTALAEYGVMLAAGVSALVLAQLPAAGQWLGLAVWAAFYAALAWRIDRAWAASAP